MQPSVVKEYVTVMTRSRPLWILPGMTVMFRIYPSQPTDVKLLNDYLSGVQGIKTTGHLRPPPPNTQGTELWHFLEVAVGSGGAAAAAMRALRDWIEARRTKIEVDIPGVLKIIIDSDKASEPVAQVSDAISKLFDRDK